MLGSVRGVPGNRHSYRDQLIGLILCGVLISLPPLESVEQDLWPIKKYMFVPDTKKAGADMIITEIIWMQRIRYIDNRDEKNLSFEFQKK